MGIPFRKSAQGTTALEHVMRISMAITSLMMAGLLCLQKDGSSSTCRVHLTLTDAATGREIPGLVRILDAEGRAVTSEQLLSRGLGVTGESPIRDWQVVPRAVELNLPRGKYTIAAISGLETEQSQRNVDLQGRAELRISIPLNRIHATATEGCVSGNTHLHLMKVSPETADRYLREVPIADRLDLVFLSYLERADADQDYISNRYTADDLARLSREAKVLFGNGEEHRHNFTAQGEGYGHVMLLNLKRLIQPASIGPGIMGVGDDGLALQRGIDAARRDQATALWCHNEWGFEALPNWFTGRVDAQNIFDGSIRSSYKDSFYRYLNAGLKVPFSTGTDWFMHDFSRVYVRMEGELTAARWLKELAAGRSFITNGPLLDLRVANRKPGDTIELDGPATVDILATAAGRVDFRQIELIRNGDIVGSAATTKAGGHYEANLKMTFGVTQPCWFALRTPPPSVKTDPELAQAAPLNEFGQELFAHTSAVYVSVAGREVFDPRVARELLAKMKAGRDAVSHKGRFEDDLSKARVLDVYDDGIAALERRLNAKDR
jgi:hypothetical protein